MRDAANLGWKLPLVVKGMADPALLDTYQPEREPNVRGVIAMAMMMGKTVCITDPEVAAARDAQMLAARAAGMAPDGALAYPPIMTGCILAGSPGAGSYFPQLAAPDGTRLDDRLGPGPWLISDVAVDSAQGLELVSPSSSDLSDFASGLQAELQRFARAAILVRPDRNIFGAGTVEALSAAWRAAMQPPAA